MSIQSLTQSGGKKIKTNTRRTCKCKKGRKMKNCSCRICKKCRKTRRKTRKSFLTRLFKL